MAANGSQRDDLRKFADQVIRQMSFKAIVMRNAGQISAGEYDRYEEVMDALSLGLIETMLDGFEPKCDVNTALDELIPLPNQMRRGGTGPLERQMIARVERAMLALRGSR